MRERLYRAGYPATGPGWVTFLAAVGFGLAATAHASGMDLALLAGLVLASWLVNLATVDWPAQWRLPCHLAAWVVLHRAVLPDRPWYLVVPLAALLAGAIIWEQERRGAEA